MSLITISSSGNCNFTYVTGLRNYFKRPEAAMADVLTVPAYNNGYGYVSKLPVDRPPMYRAPVGGIMIFAQGSEDPVKTNGYAPQFKKFIEDNGLGSVMETPPVPNPLHANKPGIMFVWIVNHEACRVWWHTSVLAVYQAKQEVVAKAAIDKDKIKKEIK